MADYEQMIEDRDILIEQLSTELTDHDRWIKDVLTDFKISFDDHKIGRRMALTQWMRDHNTKV